MKKVRWGVIGATGIADRRTIPEGIMPAANAELVAVMSPTRERVEKVAARYGGVPWFTDAREMLAAVPMDACYLGSPPAGHLEQTEACAAAGVHVFCEKPLARNVAEAEAMLAACAQRGVKLGTAFMIPFHHLAQEAMRLVRDGTLGQIVSARVQFGFDSPPVPGAFRQVGSEGGGGAFMDVGNHATDLLERIVGSKVASVLAVSDSIVYQYEGVEDACAALYRLDNGAIGMADAYFCTGGARNAVEINGSEKTLMVQGMMGQGTGGALMLHSHIGAQDAEVTIESDGRNMYVGEITAFSQAILDDTDPPISGEDGLWSQRVVAAVYGSAQTGRRVDLPGSA